MAFSVMRLAAQRQEGRVDYSRYWLCQEDKQVDSSDAAV
jgi:hypothetical protein